MTEATVVIFRKFSDGEVVALFPYEPFDRNGWTCQSYMHVGQHGAADPHIVERTRPATPEEYAPLKRELESDPYRYTFTVRKRFPSDAYRVRLFENASLRATDHERAGP